MRLLVSWIGHADLAAASKNLKSDIGPVAQALEARRFDSILLLADMGLEATRGFEVWLRARSGNSRLTIEHVELENPTNFDAIYKVVSSTLDRHLKELPARPMMTFHLSPGTPAMAAIWLILGKTRYRAELIQSSRQKGVETAALPFDITLSAELVSDVLRDPDSRLAQLSEGAARQSSSFGDIIYSSAPMRRVVERAKKAALRSVPVLIEGESGTGKELLARAIHARGLRRDRELKIVNCGAIPSELVESTLFGHERGAFTGASRTHIGHFEAADRGTLFLDEVGELPLSAQVKLLRAIQQGEVHRVGGTKALTVDVRIIAATNRNLATEVAAGRFREDLFYRLAVLVLKMPPLRDREDDIGSLIDGLLEKINLESMASGEPGFTQKTLSVGAKALMMREPWPGNVRQLENTLRRAAVWCDEAAIGEDDIRDALLSPASKSDEYDMILNRDLHQGVDLPALMSKVARHYLTRAMAETHGNKSKAAALLGLQSYQTLTNWLQRYEVT